VKKKPTIDNATHTPGPWVHDQGPSHPHNIIRSASGKYVAYTMDHDEHSSSDARLITAAPELLSVLIHFERVLSDDPDDYPDMQLFRIMQDARAAALGVIAKAEGGAA